MAVRQFLNLPGKLKMPVLGLGTWQAQDPAELENAMNAALDIGYRHFDTAWAYGNEKLIGQIMKKWFDSGKVKREDIFLSTKLPAQGVHPDRIEFFIKQSLENLQLDYIDLYLAHFSVGLQCNPKTGEFTGELEGRTDFAAVWKKMEEQVDAGRTKTIGLSNYNIAQIETIVKTARIKPANLQIELHVFLQQHDLVDFCHKNGITIVAYSPLGCPGYNTFVKSVGAQERDDLPDILRNSVIKKIADKYSKTPAQIALRYLIQRGVAAIPKSVNPKRLEENIKIFDFTIDDKDMKELTKLDVGEPSRVVTWDVIKGITKHPDYPWKRE